jgi:hypothetical protein
MRVEIDVVADANEEAEAGAGATVVIDVVAKEDVEGMADSFRIFILKSFIKKNHSLDIFLITYLGSHLIATIYYTKNHIAKIFLIMFLDSHLIVIRIIVNTVNIT